MPARPTDLARLRRQSITSIMAAMPPRSEPAPTAISTVSMVQLPASGTESPALIAGEIVVSTVREVMLGADITVSPSTELATDASEIIVAAMFSSMMVLAAADSVVMMMSIRVDAALAVTVTVPGSTPAAIATKVEMLFSTAEVKVSIGSATTKPIATWYDVVVIDPGAAGDGGDSGEGGGDCSSGHSAIIEL